MPTTRLPQVWGKCYIYAGTSLSCAAIQWWKSVSFNYWTAINPVGEMSNEEEDTPPTLGHQELRLKWDEQWGGGHPTPPTLGHQELRLKWDELVHIINKNIILQCQHTENPGVWPVKNLEYLRCLLVCLCFGATRVNWWKRKQTFSQLPVLPKGCYSSCATVSSLFYVQSMV